MSSQEFDRLLNSIREDDPGAAVVDAAAERVRAKLAMRAVDMGGRLNACDDFRALADAYREGTLSEARRMLVEDHLHSCVGCRRFFRGDQPASMVTMTPRRSRVGVFLPWAIAAVVLLAAGFTLPEYFNVLLAPSGPRASVARIDGEAYKVSPSGLMLLTVGAPIAENEQVRTAKGSRALLRLRDGSMVEVAERSDLRVSEGWRRKLVSLERGSVMVEAAKQRQGTLEISTPDCLVSVKGTIFSVSRGLKGSRVSVVEGEVKVDKSTGVELLHRGDQVTTTPAMARTSVAEDVSWSANSPTYLTLLGDLSAIQKKIEAIPGPEVRYSSKLTSLVPSNTAVFFAMPNLGGTIDEANSIFEERARQSPALSEWWNAEGARKVRAILTQVRTISDYLGNEIILAVPAKNGAIGAPMLVAEENKPGLRQFLAQAGNTMPIEERGGFVVMGTPGEGFESTRFGKRIAQSYAAGAGWLLAADMEQILPQSVKDSKEPSGMENLRYLILERKQNLGRTETSATVSFRGTREGFASWIAAPGPMGTLDFVSPDATFAASFVANNPAALLEQLSSLGGVFESFQTSTGVDVRQDIAATLGGEATVAVDGPLLPTPSWKVALEVNNPARLEWSIEQMVKAAQKDTPAENVQLKNETEDGLTYYTLSSAHLPTAVNYVFTDGYLLMAPNRNLLTVAMEARRTGNTLPNSVTFKAQLPQNGQANFSAIAYYNASAAIAPMADQLTSTKFLTDEQKKALSALTADRRPTLIYAYAEPDRLVAATCGTFAGLSLDTLLGLNGNGAALLGKLMAPALGTH